MKHLMNETAESLDKKDNFKMRVVILLVKMGNSDYRFQQYFDM